jgi:hypothetical protein
MQITKWFSETVLRLRSAPASLHPGGHLRSEPGTHVRRSGRHTRRRFAVLALALAVMGFALLVGAGVVVRDVECDACHSMSAYTAAHAASRHAGITCLDCHGTSGPFGVIADGARGLRWAISEPFTEVVTPLALSDTACRSCHADTLDTTVTGAVRVRHTDFAPEPCATCHSGSAHIVENRWYIGVQMDDCMTCHRAAWNRIDSCDMCHIGKSIKQRSPQQTAWRASHGVGWESAHGMGDLSTCPTCHAPSMCATCHGVALPHPPTWSREHGRDLAEDTRNQCATCHESAWCTACHGVEMPHPEAFLPVHGATAAAAPDSCGKCHDTIQCDVCHALSNNPSHPGDLHHPNVPTSAISVPGGGVDDR